MAETSSTGRQFSLRHIRHESKMNTTLYSMFMDQNLVDVILMCDTINIKAHKLVLSANSSYFKTLFDSLESNRCQIPIIVLKDVPLSDLKAILEFMYRGEVSVDEFHLQSVLKSAELLKVFGLTEVCHALRSRLNNESTAETTTSSSSVSSGYGSMTSGPVPTKRPRISDGIQTKPQQHSDLFSRISNARFEIRPSIVSPNSTTSQSGSGPPMRSVVSTVTSVAAKSPSLVKNVILPSSQIHRKTDAIGAQIIKSPTNVDPTKVGTPSLKSPPLKSYSNRTPVGTESPVIQKLCSNQIISSTWTPSQQKDPLPSSSGIQRSPIEVLIDEETNDASEVGDTQEDVKPPIFELKKNLNANKDVVVLNIKQNSRKSISIKPKSPKSSATSSNATETATKSDETKTKSPLFKSRSSSTSSQASSHPPPPSYRVVQRSSSRLLRNIIKPTSSVTSGKGGSDDKNKSNAKRQTVRTYRSKMSKSEIEANLSYEESSPEVECPSCGLKFTDDKKWSEHITSAHPPLHT